MGDSATKLAVGETSTTTYVRTVDSGDGISFTLYGTDGTANIAATISFSDHPDCIDMTDKYFGDDYATTMAVTGNTADVLAIANAEPNYVRIVVTVTAGAFDLYYTNG